VDPLDRAANGELILTFEDGALVHFARNCGLNGAVNRKRLCLIISHGVCLARIAPFVIKRPRTLRQSMVSQLRFWPYMGRVHLSVGGGGLSAAADQKSGPPSIGGTEFKNVARN
jgi:hypothetical protein